mgnify:CR=1 FL=1
MSEPVAVRILDREFLVGCAPEAREGLLRAAQLLDSKMREVRNGNRMAGIDRIAVIAALDLAQEVFADAYRTRGIVLAQSKCLARSAHERANVRCGTECNLHY